MKISTKGLAILAILMALLSAIPAAYAKPDDPPMEITAEVDVT